MKKLLVGLTGLGAVVLAGVAVAQAPAPPAVAQAPAPPAGAQAPAPPAVAPGQGAEMRAEHGMDEHGWRGMMHRMHREPPSKAARFMFRRGDAVVAIKCAEDEPMKACVDAAAALMDKLAAAPK